MCTPLHMALLGLKRSQSLEGGWGCEKKNKLGPPPPAADTPSVSRSVSSCMLDFESWSSVGMAPLSVLGEDGCRHVG